MKALIVCTALVAALGGSLDAQGLREVPQRFMYVQPVGLLLGVGQLGVEFGIGRATSIEVGGVGVYSREDGIEVVGGGPGIGIRRYLEGNELSGLVAGARVDGVWLRADNSAADNEFLGVALRARESDLYLGLGLLMGYRWVTTSGFLVEPSVSYEYFAGPRPLVPGSRDLQERLGLSIGIGFGWAW